MKICVLPLETTSNLCAGCTASAVKSSSSFKYAQNALAEIDRLLESYSVIVPFAVKQILKEQLARKSV